MSSTTKRRASKPRARSRERFDLDAALARVGPSAVALAEAPAPPAAGAAGSVGDEQRKQAPATPRLGTHGQNYAQGVLEEEWNSELQDWEERTGKLDEFRRGDSVVASILSHLFVPLLRATWTSEPGSTSPRYRNRGPHPFGAGSRGTDTHAPDDGAAAALNAGRARGAALQANLLGIGPAEYRMRTPSRRPSTAQSFGVSPFERTRGPTAGHTIAHPAVSVREAASPCHRRYVAVAQARFPPRRPTASGDHAAKDQALRDAIPRIAEGS